MPDLGHEVEDIQTYSWRLNKWKSLEKDAESLKKELSEDKWVAIFRNAGKQANKMMESVEKTINKVKIGTEAPNLVADAALLKLVESYETKRLHYGE